MERDRHAPSVVQYSLAQLTVVGNADLTGYRPESEAFAKASSRVGLLTTPSGVVLAVLPGILADVQTWIAVILAPRGQLRWTDLQPPCPSQYH